ncbi:MAG: HAD family hydrolase [Calditrichia bacterium]
MQTKLKGVIFDVHDTLIPRSLTKTHDLGLLDKALKQKKINYVIASNSVSQPQRRLQQDLQSAGLKLKEASIITPTSLAIEWLQSNRVSSIQLFAPKEQLGYYKSFDLWIETSKNPPDAVVVSNPPKDTLWKDLLSAISNLQKGSKLLVLHGNLISPSPEGYIPSCGFFMSALAEITNDVVLLGKPAAYFFRVCLKQLGAQSQEVLVVGDNYNIDILPALKLGMRTFWMTEEKDWKKSDQISPHFWGNNNDLLNLIEGQNQPALEG